MIARSLHLALWAALAGFAALAAYAALLQVDIYHDGLNFKSAQEIASGAVRPGEEFSQYGSVFHAINALALRLSGGRFAALKLLAAGYYALALLLLFVTCRRVGGLWPALASAAAFLWLSPLWTTPLLIWASALIMPLSILMTYLLVQAALTRGRTAALLAGAVAAVIIAVKVNIGVTVAVGVFGGGAAAAALRFGRPDDGLRAYLGLVKSFAIGWAVTLGLMAAYVAAIGALGVWTHQHVLLPLHMASFIPEVWHNRPNDVAFLLRCLFPLDLPAIWTVLPALVVAISAGAFVVVTRAARFTSKLGLALILSGVAGASWAQYYPVPDVIHTWWAAVPMLPAIAFAGREIGRAAARLAWRSRAPLSDEARARLLAASRLAAVAVVAGGAAWWLSATARTLSERAATLVPIEGVPAFAWLRETERNARDFAVIAAAIESRRGRSGPVRLATLAPDALYGVLADDQTPWSRAPSLHALYLVGPSDQPQRYHAALRDRGANRLLFTNAYAFREPAWRPLAATSVGGLVLEPAPPDLPNDLAAAPPCGRVETHAFIASPAFLADSTRFWGYLMPPIQMAGPVRLDLLVLRRRAEGPNSVILDLLLGYGPASGAQIRRHAALGDDYQLTEVIDGVARPLIALPLKPETLHHVDIRHGPGGWTVYLDGAPAGSAPSALTTLASGRTPTLGAGQRFIDSFVGEIYDWRVSAIEGECGPPDPGVAERAAARGRIPPR